MCTNYKPPPKDLLDNALGKLVDLAELTWKPEIYKDYQAPIIRRGVGGGREVLMANYAMFPMKFQRKAHETKYPDLETRPKLKAYDTMNARVETLGSRPVYRSAWKKSQLCLIPAITFREPCYETGKNVWMEIGMADESVFAVAGLWSEWMGEAGPEYAFTQLTVNADDHELMKRMHKPEDEKRSLVVVPRQDWDDWLNCSDPEYARAFMTLYPADLMKAWPKTSEKAATE
jgi:putative SOS response-associated peptidase YedK